MSASSHPFLFTSCIVFVDSAGLELYSKLHVIHQFWTVEKLSGFGLLFFFFFNRSTLGRSISMRSTTSRQSPRVMTISGPSRITEIYSVWKESRARLAS